jgi:hypothetical protein
MIPFSRRQFLSRAANGFGAAALATLLADDEARAQPAADPFAPKKPHFDPKATNVIFLFMDGGPSQVDTFDPKPALEKYHGRPFPARVEPTQFNNVGNTLASPWAFKQYGRSGLPVSDLFPHVGACADDLAVIRSVVANFSEHTNANYFMHSGFGQQGRPSVGSWVTYGLGSPHRRLRTRLPDADGRPGGRRPVEGDRRDETPLRPRRPEDGPLRPPVPDSPGGWSSAASGSSRFMSSGMDTTGRGTGTQPGGEPRGPRARRDDKPIAALLTDLKRRGLLDSTLVGVGRRVRPDAGERRGRTAATTTRTGSRMWLAGGGVKGGTVVRGDGRDRVPRGPRKAQRPRPARDDAAPARARPQAADVPVQRPRRAADRRAANSSRPRWRSGRATTSPTSGRFSLVLGTETPRPRSIESPIRNSVGCCDGLMGSPTFADGTL